MSRDARAELAEIAASVRAYVEWQRESGAAGFPRGGRGAAAGQRAPAPAPAPASAPTAPTPDSPLVLNTATEDDLRRLPGIGAKRATAIVALRAHLGRFRAIEDLLKVKGIGRATLKRLRPLVRLEAPPPPDGGGPAVPVPTASSQ